MKKISLKKGIVIFIIFCICMMAAGLLALKVYRHIKAEIRNQRGILLAFDDYNPDTWQEHFDLFDEYDVKVTFFVNLTEPTDFCAAATERGHEIGYHTAGHVDVANVSDEVLYEQAIAAIEVFREQGYELTSFAYPHGIYSEESNQKLLQHYKTLRGAYHFEGRYKENVPGGFIESYSLDNVHFESDEAFRAKVEELLDVLASCEEGTIASVYSHAISAGDWCITAERLKILFEEAEERDLVFYTFKDLQ